MEEKPLHYDGSVQNGETSSDLTSYEPVKLTDEMRKMISSNPYVIENNQ
ncbi:hypothetical protein [uncultured Metabacillus sp.]|nr:hypothetical protein [uncultured Metabacillus sp.]